MRHAFWAALALLVFSFGCQRPDVTSFFAHPAPVTVEVRVPRNVPDRVRCEKEYAAALRARLATRMVVVPEGVTPPADAVQLRVDIHDLSPAGKTPRPAVLGVATGAAVGLLSAAAGNREGAFFDGLFWGTWVGSQAADARDRTEYRLGYHPDHIRAQARLVKPGDPEPLWVASVDPYEVVEAMDPLPPGSRDDPGRILEEEAKGFSRVVVRKLSRDFHMLRVTEQRFYLPPEPAGGRR